MVKGNCPSSEAPFVCRSLELISAIESMLAENTVLISQLEQRIDPILTQDSNAAICGHEIDSGVSLIVNRLLGIRNVLENKNDQVKLLIERVQF